MQPSTHQALQQAIMFADISGSSLMYKRLGNVAAKQVVDRLVNRMRRITERCGGIVVKTIGDEIMARFSDPQQACQAATAIQRDCRQSADTNGQSPAIRIGMDYGNTLLDGDDVFGDTVNDAACVAQIASPSQIVVTQALVTALPSHLQQECEEFDRIAIKGEQDRTLIYRLMWEHPSHDHSATQVMAVEQITQRLSTKQLLLEFNNQVFYISRDDVPFIIGRDHHKAHLHVDSTLASRDHCHILLRRGKFVLVDHSTNGSYVKTPEHPEIYLRREEVPLMGEGTISIGRRANRQDSLTITYQVQ